MIPSPNSDPYLFPLPQYGFGTDIDFKTLLANNPFLYRVYTPKERSPFFDDSDPFFVAPQLDEVYARTPVEVTSATILDPLEATYSDVATHMEWTTRSKSMFLSTSFSFAWSIWEAVRRYHHGMKKDVEIAIIDASALMGRAATGVELLRKSSPEERTSQYSKWYRYCSESQAVLVHGFIPGTSVIASIPLTAILGRLPPYYLRSKTQATPSRPLDHLGWNYFDKKHNYRQFCQEITNRFFAQSQEIRFRDATGGSIRLALTLLRPWFHRMITQDFKTATNTLRALAIIIADFGGQWWAKEHSELNRILETMANTLGEELLQRFNKEDQEIHRLQDTVDTLERVIRRHETKRLTRPSSSNAKRECCSTPITPESSPKMRPRRTLSMSMTLPTRESANVQTPITPPESPAWSQIFSRNVDDFLPSVIAFQPFTPPTELPSLPSLTPSPARQRTRSRTLSSTPPTFSLGSILSPVEEVASPAEETFSPTGQSSNSKAPVPQTPKPAPQRELSYETPQTPPKFTTPHKVQYLPSPVATPPAQLDSLRRHGLHARTISDLGQGFSGSLRIEIPESVPKQLVFPPSPAGSAGGGDEDTMRTCLETAAELTPARGPGLAPSPMPEEPHTPILSATKVNLPLSALDSPTALPEKEVASKAEVDALPPLPPSPAMSWASVSTLPGNSGPASPAEKVRESFASDTTRVNTICLAPDSPVSLKRADSTSSLSSVESTSVVEPTAAGLPKLNAEVSGKTAEGSGSDLESPETPLSAYLVTPIEGSPKRGEIRYRVPRPPVGIFVSPIDSTSSTANTSILGWFRRPGPHRGSTTPLSAVSDSDSDITVDVATEFRRQHGRGRGVPAKAETGAFVVTGFLVGAFVTLFLVGTQRPRPLLSVY